METRLPPLTFDFLCIFYFLSLLMSDFRLLIYDFQLLTSDFLLLVSEFLINSNFQFVESLEREVGSEGRIWKSD